MSDVLDNIIVSSPSLPVGAKIGNQEGAVVIPQDDGNQYSVGIRGVDTLT